MLSFLFTYYKIIVNEVFVSDCPLSNARLCSSYYVWTSITLLWVCYGISLMMVMHLVWLYIYMLLCRKIFLRINRINSFVCNGFILLSFFNRLNLKQKSLRTNQFQTTTNWLSFMEKIEQLGNNLKLHRSYLNRRGLYGEHWRYWSFSCSKWSYFGKLW